MDKNLTSVMSMSKGQARKAGDKSLELFIRCGFKEFNNKIVKLERYGPFDWTYYFADKEKVK